MSMKMMNMTHLAGYLYDHKLELRESGPNSKNPGTKFIMGTIDIATDDNLVNIVPVHFTYVTATTTKGSANATFNTLMDIIDGNYKSIMSDGAEKAVKLRIDSAIDLNEFYTDRNGTEELVSAKRNEGGFVHVVTGSFDEDEDKRNTFRCDMLITNVKEVEADEERGIPAKVNVRGAVFNFRNALLPVDFNVTKPEGMSYFLSLDASNKNPTFTRVWGNQVSETIVRRQVTESAFGPDEVREVKNIRKDWVISGANKVPYEWDSEDTLTAQEVSKMIADREVYLATIKQRQDEYKASKNAAPKVTSGRFDF